MEQWHYVVYAIVENGEFKGWHLDLASTETRYPEGNVWSLDERWKTPDMLDRMEANLILNLGELLLQSRPEEENKEWKSNRDGNLPPW
mgnify:CR=1 FL=1